MEHYSLFVTMGRELPAKVSAGQTVSAAWLNSIIDYLRYLNEQQLRRKILRGTGCAARETAGGTTLSIDRQPYTRVCKDGLDTLRTEDFELRIKPKELCTVDENGHWDKIVQVHRGKVTDHHDCELEVTDLAADAQGEASGEEEGTADPDWVDVAKISVEDKAETVEVYVRMDAYPPTKAEFVKREPQEPDGRIYIPVGKVAMDKVNDLPRVYISQYQQGPIELGGGAGGSMPFDVSLVPVSVPNKEDAQAEPETKTCVQIEGGRVFLSDGKYTVIPPKKPDSADAKSQLEVTAGYVMLSLSYGSNGTLTYKYSIESLPPASSVTPQEET